MCDRRHTLLPLQLATLALAGSALSAQVLAPNLLYTSMQPCRLFDTRVAGGELVTNTSRQFNAVGVSSAGSLSSQGGDPSGCPIPGFDSYALAQVQAIAINLAVVSPSGTGVLTAWPSDQSEPNASIMNFTKDEVVLANGAVLAVRQDAEGGDITLVSNVGTHVLGDVVGYFSNGSPVQTGGYDNLSLGRRNAGNPGGSTGQRNIAVGPAALRGMQTGYSNIAVGMLALTGLQTGNSNIAIGDQAGYNYGSNESNNILIGNSGVAGNQNGILIGSTQTYTTIAGIYGQTSSGGTEVFINSGGKLGTMTSSLRFKEDVSDMGATGDDLMKLRPVTFRYNAQYDDGSRLLQYGLIAEEVAKVYPELVQYDKDGQPLGVRYSMVNAMMLNEVQKQHATIHEQAARIEAQQARLGEQATEIARQSARMEALETRLVSLEAGQTTKVKEH